MLFAGIDTDAAGVIGTILAFFAWGLWKLWQRDNVTDRRVDGLNRSEAQRGIAEGFKRHLILDRPPDEDSGVRSTPFMLRKIADDSFAKIAHELKKSWRKAQRRQMTDVQFHEYMREEWSAWLLKHICGPLRISEGACLEMAKIKAMEPEPKAGSTDDPEDPNRTPRPKLTPDPTPPDPTPAVK